MKKILKIVGVLILIAFISYVLIKAKEGNKINEADIDQDKNTQTTEPTQKVEISPKPTVNSQPPERNILKFSYYPNYQEEIIDALNTGKSIKKINDPQLKFPDSIHPSQASSYFQLKNIYFALVRQNSMNVRLENVPNNHKASFVGVLIAKHDDAQWTDYIKLVDKINNRKNNPYYIWTYSNKLLLSIVDHNGAGSGEGAMKLFSLSEKGGWKQAGCFRFGGNYNGPNLDGDYFAYSSMLSKQEQKPIEYCDQIVITH